MNYHFNVEANAVRAGALLTGDTIEAYFLRCGFNAKTHSPRHVSLGITFYIPQCDMERCNIVELTNTMTHALEDVAWEKPSQVTSVAASVKASSSPHVSVWVSVRE